MKTYFVHMVAYCDILPKGKGLTTIRPVRITQNLPDNKPELLDMIYKFGQNDFCDDKALTMSIPSVSIGDVIELENGEFWKVISMGFEQLSSKEFHKIINKKLGDE